MNYYNEIKQKLIDNEIYSAVKDYSKERNRIITYFEVGKLLNSAGKAYGEDVIGQYADKLMIEVGKKYNKSTLFKMRKFYTVFSNAKVAPLVPQLTWSHCLILLPIKDINKINYYILQVTYHNISKRQLLEKIKNREYERLDDKTKLMLKENKNSNGVTDFVKHPIIIKNKYNTSEISEKVLKTLILENLDNFLEELGTGFSYIAHEYKIKIGNRYNYIDLLLFNYKYNCFVVLELKVTELKKEHVGQIETYMNYIDKNVKSINQDKTIGIIIVKKENKFILEYCSDKRIFETEYRLI